MSKPFVALLPVIAAAFVACGQPKRAATGPSPGPSTLGYAKDVELRLASIAAVDVAEARSPSVLGDFARSRSAQMNFCYEEALAQNPKLAGAISVGVTITAEGNVTDVDVIRRSWSGKGTEPLEECIRTKIRGWKFPPADTPTATYPFSFSFTR